MVVVTRLTVLVVALASVAAIAGTLYVFSGVRVSGDVDVSAALDLCYADTATYLYSPDECSSLKFTSLSIGFYSVDTFHGLTFNVTGADGFTAHFSALLPRGRYFVAIDYAIIAGNASSSTFYSRCGVGMLDVQSLTTQAITRSFSC